MIIDTHTLLVSDIAISIIFFITFAIYAFKQQTHPGFLPWTCSLLAQGLAFLPLVVLPTITNGFTLLLPHFLLVLALVFKLHGLRSFLGQPAPSPIIWILPFANAAIAGFFFYFSPDISMRNTSISVILALLMLMMAWDFTRYHERSARLFSYLGAFVLLAGAVSLLLRGYEWFGLHLPVPSLFDAGNHEALHLFVATLATIALNTLFLLLNSNRTHEHLVTINKSLRESDDRYRTLARAAFEAIVLSKDGKIIQANENTSMLFGYENPAAIQGMSPAMFVAEKDRDLVRANALSAEEKQYEVTGLRRDGSTFPIEVQSRPTTYRGELARVTAIRDITNRKKHEEMLRERERLFRALFETNSSIMLLIDPNSADIIDANKAACRYYGYSKNELVSMKISDINMLTKEEIYKEMDLAASEERDYFNFNHRLASGDIHPVEVFSGPITYQNRPLLCSIVHDITARKHVEKEREELITSLQKALKEIKTLRGILPICAHCHNIRNDEGSWSKLEHYVRTHSDATFSHGICPDCVREMYPEIADEIINSTTK